MGACVGTVCDRQGMVLVRGTPIVPVVPSSTAAARGAVSWGERRALPLARLAAGGGGVSGVYGIAAVDCRGRIADRVVTSALGWAPGSSEPTHCGGSP